MQPESLKEYIRKRKQMEVAELFGSIDYDWDFNYKEGRNKHYLHLVALSGQARHLFEK